MEKDCSNTSFVGNVRREGDSLYVVGVERMTHGTGIPNAYVSALASILHTCGVNSSYGYLFGMSGIAFRLVINRDCGPSIRDWGADVGEGCKRALWRAAGFERQSLCIDDSVRDSPKEFNDSIREHLGAVRPLLSTNIGGEDVHGVIAGLDGSSMLCRVLGEDTNVYSRCEMSVSQAETLGDRIVGIDKQMLYLEALQRGVRLAGKGRVMHGDDSLVIGVDAYRVWAEWLRDEAARCELDKVEFSRSVSSNYILFRWLVDARLCLPTFLRSTEAELGLPENADAVAEAASLYARLADKLKSGLDFTDVDPEQWTPLHRAEQADLLEKCAELEALAAQSLAKCFIS